MADGLTTYFLLRFHLSVDGSTLTKYAASLGTSQQHLRDVIVRHAPGYNGPDSDEDFMIWAAVQRYLAEHEPVKMSS